MKARKSRELSDDAFRELLVAAGRRSSPVPAEAADRALAEVTRHLPLQVPVQVRLFTSMACGALLAAAVAVVVGRTPPSLGTETFGAGGVGAVVSTRSWEAGRPTAEPERALPRAFRMADVGAGRM